MSDSHVTHLLARVFDEPLSQVERALVDSHLESCAFCRAEDYALHGLEDLLRRVSAVAPDEGFPLRVMERVREAELIVASRRWLIPILLFLFGTLVAYAWLWSVAPAFDTNIVIGLVAALLTILYTVFAALPVITNVFDSLLGIIGDAPVIAFAIAAFLLTVLWAYAVSRTPRESQFKGS